jgi:hypothetical protein
MAGGMESSGGKLEAGVGGDCEMMPQAGPADLYPGLDGFRTRGRNAGEAQAGYSTRQRQEPVNRVKRVKFASAP